MTISPERKREFLREYAALCRRLGVMVESCGCCGSPWVEPVETPKELEDHLLHLYQMAGLNEAPAEPPVAPTEAIRRWMAGLVEAPAEPPAAPTETAGRRGLAELDKAKEEVAEGLRSAYAWDPYSLDVGKSREAGG